MIQSKRVEAEQLREFPRRSPRDDKPKNIPRIANEVLKKHSELGKSRVDVLKIAFAEKIHVIKNSSVNELCPGEYGIIMCNLATNEWIMVYDDTLTLDQKRFTVAHELGHYFLGHKDECANGGHVSDPEREANLFAMCLLMKKGKTV